MVATNPFRPEGYIYSEDALLRIAKARHPERWKDELLHPKEAEIYTKLNQPEGFNAQVLQYILMDEIPLADLNANPGIARRLRDFDYAAYDLQIALHSGDIIAEYVDKRGEFGWIKSSSWGGDNAMSILLLGVVDLEDGAYGRRILFKIDSIDKFAGQPTTEPKAANRPGRRARQGSLAAIDAPLLVEMKKLIENLRAASPEEAARMVVKNIGAHGSGTIDSKVERL